MLTFLNDLKNFIKDVANDPRIPSRDKKMVLALFALIISPFDIIPDWIPIIGWLDDLLLLATILDYFFEVLDQEIILSHFPWDMKKYACLRRLSRMITGITPRWLKKILWKFEGSPYR